MISASESVALNALVALGDDVLRDRCSFSMETLSLLYKRLHLVASLLQETMNSHCPVNKLPPEILAHVFSLVPCALPLGIGYRGCTFPTQTYELIPVSHVCRRWRDVALGTPSLWSTICETPAAYKVSNVLHARAQHAPLVVHVDRNRPSAALTDLLCCPSTGARVTELYLHDVRDLTTTELLVDLLAFPAPRLERVVVRRRAGRSAAADIGSLGMGAKPVIELFDGVAPKLKSLVLHDVPFLASNWFDSLTHLWLSFEVSPIHWILPDLIQLFHQTPALLHAKMVGLPTHLHSPDLPTLSTATLPCLSVLEIGGHSGQENPIALMRAILSYLVLPSSCAIRLYGVDAKRLSPLADVRLAFVEQPTSLAIEVSFTTLALTGTNPQAGHSLCLELNTAGTTKTLLHQSIEAFLVSASSSAIREVTIAGQRVWPAWCDPNMLLSMLPNATSLTLADAHLVDECLEALRPFGSQSVDPAGPSRVLCLTLETLHIPFELTDLLMQKLRAVLGERALHGSHMQCIVADQHVSC